MNSKKIIISFWKKKKKKRNKQLKIALVRHKIIKGIPNKEAEDPSPMDQTKSRTLSSIRKQKILSQ